MAFLSGGGGGGGSGAGIGGIGSGLPTVAQPTATPCGISSTSLRPQVVFCSSWNTIFSFAMFHFDIALCVDTKEMNRTRHNT